MNNNGSDACTIYSIQYKFFLRILSPLKSSSSVVSFMELTLGNRPNGTDQKERTNKQTQQNKTKHNTHRTQNHLKSLHPSHHTTRSVSNPTHHTNGRWGEGGGRWHCGWDCRTHDPTTMRALDGEHMHDELGAGLYGWTADYHTCLLFLQPTNPNNNHSTRY